MALRYKDAIETQTKEPASAKVDRVMRPAPKQRIVAVLL